MILGLDEMVLECIDDNARSHIREACGCYEKGAYRASIIAAYIAVSFDLVAKLKTLSAAGDAAAGTLVAHLDKLKAQQLKNDPNAISGLLEFERKLLEVFKDSFGFFGIHEYEELRRLREDRNRCAHPTFANSDLPYNPSAELARLHIRNAIRYVLSQHPKQGKAAIESLRKLILSPYFPDVRIPS